MPHSLGEAFFKNFLGRAPGWYKVLIVTFLFINPVTFYAVSPFLAGWLLVAEFIFTLSMALECYPLQPGGLLAIEAIAVGMTSVERVKDELAANLEVLMLLIFMVSGIYFIKELLLFIFTKILLVVRSKVALSVSFCMSAAFLSAFLDALTVVAVIISVTISFYDIYYKVMDSGERRTVYSDSWDWCTSDLSEYRGFLRSLLMHAGIGSALGGVMTMVGEPQNLIIADKARWSFGEFIIRMSPVALPVLICGVVTCILLEKMHWFGYGQKIPDRVRVLLVEFDRESRNKRSKLDTAKLWVQGAVSLWLILGLALHLAAVGLVGLSIIIIATAFTGIVEEHALGDAFKEALPFAALLVVFFSVVAIIIDQQLFKPFIDAVLRVKNADLQLALFYVANGLLSMISDNVFVGTIYINEVKSALISGAISQEQFDLLAVAINSGTNLPSVATPNGQAAFLFLLTSSLAPLIKLSYSRMVLMALPYTIVLTAIGLIGIVFLISPVTAQFYEWGVLVK